MFIFRTKGVCPPEIHFEISGDLLKNVSFVGGGCRGNAQLITRLLEGLEVSRALPLLKGIQCRNGTSCPVQLCQAIEQAIRGDLAESGDIRVHQAPQQFSRVAVVADLKGDLPALQALLRVNADALICLGNSTGPDDDNNAVLEAADGERVIFLQGPGDRTDSNPHFFTFSMGNRRAVGFYSGYIQELTGFSDYSRFSLELLMVCNLSGYLQNEEVFPALLAMTDQFEADVVLFAHTGLYRHIKLGSVDFINVGPVKQGDRNLWAILELEGEDIRVSFEATPDISGL